ncbi:capsular polysaccharide export protein, LipB/KpsS family [Rhizobium nepotum]|uniref:capsular polysaccharide export protein, LipB/KpsS family n=1 Tax=Rhizobium nepotum TaxID=1035271 RepID=UPI0006979CD7|nr:glycosyltransferase [Rhizobium nepotum]
MNTADATPKVKKIDNFDLPNAEIANLHKLDASAKTSSPSVAVSDITMAFGVRLHSGNPWLLDRLGFMSDYYKPCPKIAVVDFGSDPENAAKLKALCNQRGYTYKFTADFDVFSLAAARNLSFEASTTDFVFFCDPDFISERDFFQRLAETATALEMRETVDIIINPPAVHLDAESTASFEDQPCHDSRSSLLRKLNFTLNYVEVSRQEERFIAPYSNCFLVNRNMFSLVGGYDKSFRGHGSEDFEFLLRFNIISDFLPLPENANKDFHAPLAPDFFSARPYKGFRRLFEMMSQPSEGLGLRVYHLHHPRERSGDWYANNDWKRNKFEAATQKYTPASHNLLSIDHLTRRKRIACLCKNNETWGYFLPLRLAGYELIPYFDDQVATLKQITDAIISGEVDDVAIFNPYMASHSAYKGIVLLARELGRNIVVIERGALPGTIYYDQDVCYNSESFSESSYERENFSPQENSEAWAYIERLRQGHETLEAMDSYEITAEKYGAYSKLRQKVCFIPLQLEEDMAVTMFIKGKQTYPEFVAALPKLFRENPDILFIVKPHPLSKGFAILPTENVVIANRDDNVHFLLDLASLTLCYNSGVGLLSLAHETPTITLGNAFYNMCGVGYRAQSAAEGLMQFKANGIMAPSKASITRLLSWFLFRKYSTFIATDKIVETEKRKSHGYKNIWVTKFMFNGEAHILGKLKQRVKFSWQSYAIARLSPQDLPLARKNAPDHSTLVRWGLKDFHNGEYIKSAKHLTEAYRKDQGRPILLRYAAEAHYRSQNRDQAIEAVKESLKVKPIKRAQARMWVFRFPILRFLIGSHELKVPKR